MEHQAAIALLCGSHLFGSMHAMMRILVESVVRGLWILHCATEAELDLFEKRGMDKRFGELTAEVEAAIGAHHPTHIQMKANAWNALNDFAHTGYTQITCRLGDEALGSNYPEEDVIKCINAAGAFGLIASAQLSAMAKQDALTEARFQKMRDFSVAITTAIVFAPARAAVAGRAAHTACFRGLSTAVFDQ